MERRSIIIVGSGPAGLSTALSLHQMAPELARELLVLEKYRHPRHKLCGGGMTAYADIVLSSLKIPDSAASFPIDQVRMTFDNTDVRIQKKSLMRIVHRAEFDAGLAGVARARGIEIREMQAVESVERQGDELEIATKTETFLAKVVVAADGARSIIRRKLFAGSKSRVSRLMEALIPVVADNTPHFSQSQASLDFRPRRNGLQGYVWDFPVLVNSEPHLNIGIFDSRIRRDKRADLPAILNKHIRDRRIDNTTVNVMAHPERWFHEADSYSADNVLLTGDAAGIEPLLGEGISMALAYGPVAARTIIQAMETGDYSFRDYRTNIMNDKLGRLLRRNRRLARMFYTIESRVLEYCLIAIGKLYLNRKYGHSGLRIDQGKL